MKQNNEFFSQSYEYDDESNGSGILGRMFQAGMIDLDEDYMIDDEDCYIDEEYECAIWYGEDQ